MPTRHVIVGCGIAGLSAAEAIRHAEPDALITMIGDETHPVYSRPGLAYLLRGDIPEKQLWVRTPEELQALRLNRLHGIAEQFNCAKHEIRFVDGPLLPYDRLLIATGASAVPPSFPGGDLAGVVKLDSLEDVRSILKQAGRRRTAVVVGGGITALELAEGLQARRMQVHYFLRGERYWSDVLDETESLLVQDRLQHDGVLLRTNTQVKQALGKKGQLIAVETQTGETIPCQMLAVAIGVRPRADLARKAGLKVDRGILVNEFLQTNMPDVYAAGDVAQVHDPHSGCATLDVLWSTALAQGRAAGANMAGGRQAYVKGVAFNVTQLAGLKVSIIGAVGNGCTEDLVAINRGDSEAWRRAKAWAISEQEDVNRVRLLIGERTLVGALVMGDQSWSRPLYRLISANADITSIRPALVGGGAAALMQLAEYYQRWESRPQ